MNKKLYLKDRVLHCNELEERRLKNEISFTNEYIYDSNKKIEVKESDNKIQFEQNGITISLYELFEIMFKIRIFNEFNEYNESKILPIIRSIEYIEENLDKEKCRRREVGVGLYTVLGIECKNSKSILTHSKIFGYYEDIAYRNLEKLNGKFEVLYEDLEVYILKSSNSSWCASMILNETIQKQAMNSCGDDFIFIIPSDDVLIIAPNTDYYHMVLSDYMNVYGATLSKEVYFFEDGYMIERTIDCSIDNDNRKKKIPNYVKIIK